MGRKNKRKLVALKYNAHRYKSTNMLYLCNYYYIFINNIIPYLFRVMKSLRTLCSTAFTIETGVEDVALCGVLGRVHTVLPGTVGIT